MSKKADVIKSIVVLAVICLVISGALAIVNSFTAPVIENAAAERENQARQSVMPEAASFEPLEQSDFPEGVVSGYQGLDSASETVGYVFTVEG